MISTLIAVAADGGGRDFLPLLRLGVVSVADSLSEYRRLRALRRWVRREDTGATAAGATAAGAITGGTAITGTTGVLWD